MKKKIKSKFLGALPFYIIAFLNLFLVYFVYGELSFTLLLGPVAYLIIAVIINVKGFFIPFVIGAVIYFIDSVIFLIQPGVNFLMVISLRVAYFVYIIKSAGFILVDPTPVNPRGEPWKCPKCGSKWDAQREVCAKCNTPKDPRVNEIWTCPECNETNPNNIYTCKSCGYALK